MTAGTSREAVLIPTGRQMKSYGCLRSLHQQGIHTVVASECDWIPHVTSRFCSEFQHLPAHWNDLRSYKAGLLDIASRPDVKTILPIRECDTYLLANYRDQFEQHVSVIVPTAESLERAHDRRQLAREAGRAGVPYADTRLLSAVDTWDRDVVIKSRYNILTDAYVESVPDGRATEVGDVHFVEAGEQPDVDAIQEEMDHDPIVQEFIPEAKKHLYCALWMDGEPVATYQHRQLRKMSWVGGGGVYRKSVRSSAVESVAYDLLSELDWHGFACIEYVKDERTGEWRFLELNPRVWLSLPEAVRAGMDFPYYYWQCAHDDHAGLDPDYETGIACHASFGEFNHLLSVLNDESPFLDAPSFPRRLVEILASCVIHPRFEYIRRDDPRFFVNALRALPSMTVGGRYTDVDDEGGTKDK